MGEGGDEPTHGELAGDVEHAPTSGVEARRRACQHHAAAGGGERVEGGPHAHQHRRHVGMEQLVERRHQHVGGDVAHAAVEVEDPHARHPHVEPAVTLDDGGHRGVVGVGRRGVAGDDDGRRVIRGDGGALGRVAVEHADRRSGVHEGVVHGAAYPRAGADDQRPLAVEDHRSTSQGLEQPGSLSAHAALAPPARRHPEAFVDAPGRRPFGDPAARRARDAGPDVEQDLDPHPIDVAG